MSRKGSKNKEEPEDPVNKALLEELKFERLSTALKQNEYDQKVIEEKLKQLEDGKREHEQTFLSGMSYREGQQLVEELQGIKLNLYLVLGDFVDRSKKMKPDE